jgi:hypothetical protein
MATKLTPADLLARIEQTSKDTEVFKNLWQDYFPPDLPFPPDWEIKNAVRRLALADLEEGMKSYLVILSDGSSKPNPTPKNVLNYICGAAWGIREKENPDQAFHPTARRIRNAKQDPDSNEWDGEAFHNASPEERQRIIAKVVAKQKKKAQR